MSTQKPVWDQWMKTWESYSTACESLNGRILLNIDDPATEEEIKEFENDSGIKIPESMREVALNFSKGFDFLWTVDLPSTSLGKYNPTVGEFKWNLFALPELIEFGFQDMKSNCNFNDPAKTFDQIWMKDVLPFCDQSADFYAVSREDHDAVIFISHDDDSKNDDGSFATHGHVLGNNFQDFITRWLQIGCPNMPFLWQRIRTEWNAPIDPSHPLVLEWRDKMSLKW